MVSTTVTTMINTVINPVDVRVQRLILHILALAMFALLAYALVGFTFGTRGMMVGDDWYTAVTSEFDQYPLCLNAPTMINAQRLLLPTPMCVAIQLFGINMIAIHSITILGYTLYGIVWYLIVRQLFGLPLWMCVLVGVIAVVYPDNSGRMNAVWSSTILGMALTLLGILFLLYFQARPHNRLYLLVGCLIAAWGLLMYELLIGVWLFGLPIALFYKQRRINRTLVTSTLCVATTVAVYFFWRFLLLPQLAGDSQIIVGTSSEPIDLTNVAQFFSQVGEIYGMAIRMLPMSSVVTQWVGFSEAERGKLIFLTYLTVLAFAVLFVVFVRRERKLDVVCPAPNPAVIAPFFFGIGLIPLAVLPSLFTNRSFLETWYSPLGIPLGVSLALPLLLLVRHHHWRLGISCVTAFGAMIYGIIFSAHIALHSIHYTGSVCDFMLRMAAAIPEVPPETFVVVEITDPYLPMDEYIGSELLSLIYYNGERSPASYSYGHFGHNGYVLVKNLQVQMRDTGFGVDWVGMLPFLPMRYHPPLSSLPLDQTIALKYDTRSQLTILHLPTNLSATNGQGVPQDSEAFRRAQQVCGWFTPSLSGL
jgi:hypothetical protein